MKNVQLKITDFGLSKKAEVFYSNSGTREFAAPEYYTDGYELGKNKSIDIWALGCTFFSILTGRRPFVLKSKGGNFEFKIEKLKEADLDLEEHIYDEDCKNIIKLCVQKDPSKRIDAKNLLKVNFFLKKS